jgi:hypothetical protein
MLLLTSFLITFVLLDVQGLFLSWANRSLLETKACSLPMHTIHPTMCLWHVLAHVFEHLQVRVMSSAEKKGGLGNTRETVLERPGVHGQKHVKIQAQRNMYAILEIARAQPALAGGTSHQ